MDRRVRRGLSTITTKRTRHLSYPPIQYTRQPSIRSPRATGLNKRRNLVSTSMAPMHGSDGRGSQGGARERVVHFLTEGKPRPRAPHGRPMFCLTRNRSGRCVIHQRGLMMPYEEQLSGLLAFYGQTKHSRRCIQRRAAPINQGWNTCSICPPISNNRFRLYSTWKFEY
jgi:hypothetical protein